MDGSESRDIAVDEPVRIVNGNGRSPIILICEHASNAMPAKFAALGLGAGALLSHIAWDPGAVAVAEAMSARLDATLVASSVSRLIVDCNRALDAPDLIPTKSENIVIPGNRGLSAGERLERIAFSHTPFHQTLERICATRIAAGTLPVCIAIHSFTPVYNSKRRPWHIGLVFDDDRRLADPLAAALAAIPGIVVGMNQPYSPADRVYYTLFRHASSNGLMAVMIEIRNDLLTTRQGQKEWSSRLSSILGGILHQQSPEAPSMSVVTNPARQHDHESGALSQRADHGQTE
jgi:predicted N-formylglutamate amidohydrolase